MIVAGTLCNKMAPALRKVRSVPCPLCRSALAVCLSAVCLSVCPSVCLHLSVYASLCLSLFLLSMSIVCSCAVPLAAAFSMLLRFPKAVSSPGARRRNLVESALNIPGFRFFFLQLFALDRDAHVGAQQETSALRLGVVRMNDAIMPRSSSSSFFYVADRD